MPLSLEHRFILGADLEHRYDLVHKDGVTFWLDAVAQCEVKAETVERNTSMFVPDNNAGLTDLFDTVCARCDQIGIALLATGYQYELHHGFRIEYKSRTLADIQDYLARTYP